MTLLISLLPQIRSDVRRDDVFKPLPADGFREALLPLFERIRRAHERLELNFAIA